MEQQNPDIGEGPRGDMYEPEGLTPQCMEEGSAEVAIVEELATLAEPDKVEPAEAPAPEPVRKPSVKRRKNTASASDRTALFGNFPQRLAPELVLTPLDDAASMDRSKNSKVKGDRKRKSDEIGSSSETLRPGQQTNQDRVDKGKQPVLSSSTARQRSQNFHPADDQMYTRSSSSSDLQFADIWRIQRKFTTELPTPPYAEEQLEKVRSDRAEHMGKRKGLLVAKDAIEKELMENKTQIDECNAKVAVGIGHLTEEGFAAAMAQISISRFSIATGSTSSEPAVSEPTLSETVQISNEFPTSTLAPIVTQSKPISLFSTPATALDSLADVASQFPRVASHNMTQPQPLLPDLGPCAGPSMSQSRQVMPPLNPYSGLANPHTGPRTTHPAYRMAPPIMPRTSMQPQLPMARLDPRLVDPMAHITPKQGVPATAQSIPQFTRMAISAPFQQFPDPYQQLVPAQPVTPVVYPGLSHNMPQSSQKVMSLTEQQEVWNDFFEPKPTPSMPGGIASSSYLTSRAAQVESQIEDALGFQSVVLPELLPRVPSLPPISPAQQYQDLFSNPFVESTTTEASADVQIENFLNPSPP